MSKPIAIFRHARTEGPGTLADFLNERQLPWTLFAIDEGMAVPESAEAFSGLVFMGGPMSVNDDLPWIPKLLDLIREAVAKDIPVLGHCLGGQLMSKALGGQVGKTPLPEIGWGEVHVLGAEAAPWFGDNLQRFLSFHWHGETFTIPPGAAHVLRSPYCENQAFVLGKHIGFQCHIEMNASMVNEWCDIGRSDVERDNHSPAVQTIDEMRTDLDARLRDLRRVASRVYTHWIAGLKH